MFRAMVVVLMLLCFLVSGYCDTVTVSKVDDQQVKIVTTTEQIVNLKDLVEVEKKLVEAKAGFDAEYKQKSAQIDTALEQLRDKIKQAKEAGVIVQTEKPQEK